MKTTALKKPVTSSKTSAKSNDSLLRDYFVDSIRDIYWAEKNMLKALSKMEKASTSPELKKAFKDHAKVTETHIERVQEAFEAIGVNARAKKCAAMEGIIAEGEEIIEDTEEGTATRDVGLIMAAQKAEHYEIASYGGLAQLARTLGENQVSDIFSSILEEEKHTDLLLTEIAENNINYEASQENK